jgi:hypothetical protein
MNDPTHTFPPVPSGRYLDDDSGTIFEYVSNGRTLRRFTWTHV